ncbi:MAG: hypothetical protein AAB268_01510 [Elusimicrobiota bacterium]
MKLRMAVVAMALMTGAIGATAAELPSVNEVLSAARERAGQMTSTPIAAEVVLPPGWTIKTKLTEEELAKFRAWAEYAHKKKNGSLAYGWRNTYSMDIVGDLGADGSLTLKEIRLNLEGPSYDTPLKPGWVRFVHDSHELYIDMDGGLYYVDCGTSVGPEEMSTQANQEIIQNMIAYWMKYRVPQ